MDPAQLKTNFEEQIGKTDAQITELETNLAKEITKELKIPTIGIGSSVNCDGQVLVTDDLIGLNLTSIKFVKSFYNIRKHIELAVKKFNKDVKNKKYPSSKYSY